MEMEDLLVKRGDPESSGGSEVESGHDNLVLLLSHLEPDLSHEMLILPRKSLVVQLLYMAACMTSFSYFSLRFFTVSEPRNPAAQILPLL